MKLFDVYPLNNISITKGKGSWVWDEEGNKYLDYYGGHAVISIGHAHPHYVERLKNQLDQLSFYSNSVILKIQSELAELLGKVSGKEDYQLFLCNSGAEANENALKLASFYNGRKKVVSFKGAFHGRTSLAVSATDNKNIIAPVNETNNIEFLPFNDVESLKSYFEENGNEVSSIIVEGIQGVGGIQVASQEFLSTIRDLCDTYNCIYIADEVQCGYGRTGKFFYPDHYNIQADIYTMAKGMGNGFPIGGILIANKFEAKHGMLGTTFGGNPLACASALAVLEVIQEENLMQNAENIGKQLLYFLSKNEQLNQPRGEGLMIGFDVPELYQNLRKELLEKSKILTGASGKNTIRLLPSLSVTKEETEYLLNAISELTQ